jgi:Flp pilus assembly CpaF family ATPase
VLAYFDRPGTSNGPIEAINGCFEHLRGSALGFRNLTNYIALFGLGGFQPFLDDPEVESVNANGCDQVFVQYAGGRRVRAAPIAGSDDELTGLVRAIATRAGNEERRFDRATPWVSVPLPGGRLFALMAVTGRPCVAIRRGRLAAASPSWPLTAPWTGSWPPS